jgi:hypothetical protein
VVLFHHALSRGFPARKFEGVLRLRRFLSACPLKRGENR